MHLVRSPGTDPPGYTMSNASLVAAQITALVPRPKRTHLPHSGNLPKCVIPPPWADVIRIGPCCWISSSGPGASP